MELQNLQCNYPLLISYLKENNYIEVYIQKFKKIIDYIFENAGIEKWKSYKDIYLSFIKITESKSTLREIRNILGALERFDLEGVFPSRLHRNHFLNEPSYNKLRSEFKNIIDTYIKHENERGILKKSSIYSESNNVSSFFLSLQRNGITTMKEVTEEAVNLFFYKDGIPCKGYSYKKVICSVINKCIPYFPQNTFDGLLLYLPPIRPISKNIQYLTKEEIFKVGTVLNNSNSILCLRDRAVGIVALYTGLRSCDIAKLRIEDIDWDKDIISIIQQKTGNAFELPLRAVVGNAIYEYILNERPKNINKEIFLSQQLPYTRLTRTSMYDIAKRIFAVADIRLMPGDRKGLHLFRHNLATTLLENGASQPVISVTMGHQAVSSLNSYLSTSLVNLKRCALSIQQFPIKKEVLL